MCSYLNIFFLFIYLLVYFILPFLFILSFWLLIRLKAHLGPFLFVLGAYFWAQSQAHWGSTQRTTQGRPICQAWPNDTNWLEHHAAKTPAAPAPAPRRLLSRWPFVFSFPFAGLTTMASSLLPRAYTNLLSYGMPHAWPVYRPMKTPNRSPWLHATHANRLPTSPQAILLHST